jgi:hypothetical protein
MMKNVTLEEIVKVQLWIGSLVSDNEEVESLLANACTALELVAQELKKEE